MTISVHHRRQGATTVPAVRVTRTKAPPETERLLRIAGCAHRGNETRRVGCKTCSGRVQVKVLACAVHGECTIAKAVTGLHVCTDCGEWEPRRKSLP